jgi:hypothetical protein
MIWNIFYKSKIFIVTIILFLVFLVYFLFRDNTYSKDEPMSSKEIAKSGIYREVYRVYGGGVYGGDVRTVYLTDSLTFRKYVGKMFDHEQIVMKCINRNQIAVLKLDLDKEPPRNVIDSTVYSLSDLKKESKWE